MILRNGIDIIDIRRINNTLDKFGDKFKNRCFTHNEIIRSENTIKSANSYAKRYAAKEACAKALGTGLARGVFWKDIEIYNNKHGKPKIKLHNKALEFLKEINNDLNCTIELSLTDEFNYAIANVIIYENKKTK